MHKRALCLAVRDQLKTAYASHNWTALALKECEVMFDGRPPPRAGKKFVSVHRGGRRNTARNNTLDELYYVDVTLTLRVNEPFDKLGANLLELATTGLDDIGDQIRAIIHMNEPIRSAANTYIENAANAWPVPPAQVYVFSEPLRYLDEDLPQEVGAYWFSATPEQDGFLGVALTMHFGEARCAQPLAIQQ